MAIYNLSNPLHRRQAQERLSQLCEKGAKIELTEKRKARTYSQNSYTHMILTAWGNELGYDLDEMKQIVKRYLLPSMFERFKNGFVFYRSFSDLDTKENTVLIDKIRLTAMEQNGYYIPLPNEEEELQSLANEVERYGY